MSNLNPDNETAIEALTAEATTPIPDDVDEAITAFEARKREMTHHASCTTDDTPKRTDDWSLVDCPTCLSSKGRP
jgi:hypothetical protein